MAYTGVCRLARRKQGKLCHRLEKRSPGTRKSAGAKSGTMCCRKLLPTKLVPTTGHSRKDDPISTSPTIEGESVNANRNRSDRPDKCKEQAKTQFVTSLYPSITCKWTHSKITSNNPLFVHIEASFCLFMESRRPITFLALFISWANENTTLRHTHASAFAARARGLRRSGQKCPFLSGISGRWRPKLVADVATWPCWLWGFPLPMPVFHGW
jgi:hypothetical protein